MSKCHRAVVLGSKSAARHLCLYLKKRRQGRDQLPFIKNEMGFVSTEQNVVKVP